MNVDISKKKNTYTIIPPLRKYLKTYAREKRVSIAYSDLQRFDFSTPIIDNNGEDTLWESVFYSQHEMNDIYEGLKKYMPLCIWTKTFLQ